MEAQQAVSLLDQLKNGEVDKVHIAKEDFLSFRLELIKREDFKHFRGIAQRGGSVVYTYLEVPRS
ncbi:MAG: hypothetical protein ACI35O_09170 [Bacillaceae bacterium]